MPRLKKKQQTQTRKPQLLPGLSDILPEKDASWGPLIQKLQRLAKGFGYSRIDLPILEYASLYDNWDMEEQTLITFVDPEANKIAVRPSILPGLMRAYSEQKFGEDYKFSKWFYFDAVTSYNEKQKSFSSGWEYGFELLGEFSPLAEVQLMSLALKFLQSFGLENVTLEVNSVGKTECRVDYEEALRNYLQSKKYDLCNECAASIEEYPLRVFRCKNLDCQTVAAEAPPIVDSLDEDCHKHFAHILEGLDEIGIPYSLNPMLVGKEGTSQTVFAIKYKDAYNEYFFGEGGFHEDITKELTGKQFSCFGFVGYLDVLQKAVQASGFDPSTEIRPEVFLVPLGDLASKKALRLFSELWDEGVVVHSHFGDTGVKNQLKLAENYKAVIALIIGQKEAMDEMVILRDVKSGMQEVFQYERIIEEVKKRLGK